MRGSTPGRSKRNVGVTHVTRRPIEFSAEYTPEVPGRTSASVDPTRSGVATRVGWTLHLKQEVGPALHRMPVWRETHPGVEELRVAVMGCVVNGPGESKHADIGISLPGTFEEPVAPVFVDGKLDRTLRGDSIVPEFLAMLDEYIDRRFPAGAVPVG